MSYGRVRSWIYSIFFMDFSGKKIVPIYYTNGGVRYWIHSHYLAFLNKNNNGLYILRVWFLEVCPRCVICMAVSRIFTFGSICCWAFIFFFSFFKHVEHLSQSDVVQFLLQHKPTIHPRNLKVITKLIQQVQGTIDIFMQIYYKMYSECNWNKKIKMKKN